MAIDYTKYHSFTADNAKVFEDVRFILKNDELATWQNSTGILEKGEIALARVNVTKPDGHGGSYTVPTYLMKVGDGTNKFADLNWLAAPASDVHAWAKKSALDPADLPSIPVEKLPVDAIDTDLDTRYTFEIPTEGDDAGKLVVTSTLYTKGVAGTPAKVAALDFITPDELTTILSDYYTKNDIDEMVDGKLHTQEEIETIAVNKVNALIEGAVDGDAIEKIADLVTYVDEHADVVAQMNEDISTANNNASEALSTANTANANASEALSKANEALNGAEGAAASAAAAKASEDAAKASENAAKASENAAKTSENAAAGSAGAAAQSKADAENAKAAAAGSASEAATAKAGAETAAENAVAAQGKAESAQAAAENAKDAAVVAQGEAEKARDAALQAKADANTILGQVTDAATGAQATANEAKTLAEQAVETANTANGTANAAKAAADAATEAVAGLHAIATSGSTDDLVQGAKTIVFNCGGAFNA